MVRALILFGLLGLMISIESLAEDLVDPTQPPSRVSEHGNIAEMPSVVSALILRKDKSTAIVGTRLVRVGDKLGGGRISRIDERGVWVKGPTGHYRYTLLSEGSQHRRFYRQGPAGTDRAQTRGKDLCQ